MQLIRNITSIKKQIKKIKQKQKTIGLVPTMGYLHEGHISLVRKASKECDIVVVSIFVNPTQFGPKEDYKRYPRNLARDLSLLKKEKVDIVFMPQAKLMYTDGYQTYVNVERLSKVICGISRPTHFRGVATIVTKLFNVVEPDIAYFGQKDAQQAIIIGRMIKDLNMNVRIKTLPIIRERNGLAMSSRNVYLNREERIDATILYKSLKEVKRLIYSGVRNPNKIIEAIKKIIKSVKGAKIDYISIVDTENLIPQKVIRGKVLIALAVYFGKVRLIDNIIVKV